MPEDDGGTESPSAPLLLPAPQPLPAAHSVGTTPFSSDVSLIETPTISGSDLLVGQSYHLRRHGCWNTSLRDQSHLCFPSLILSTPPVDGGIIGMAVIDCVLRRPHLILPAPAPCSKAPQCSIGGPSARSIPSPKKLCLDKVKLESMEHPPPITELGYPTRR